ncbi:MAG TPA: hypothetical protein VMR25_25870 [Planctomycetaceae bacterium]|jgi:hypothetical protein|nr:hypothetical protein [Planctomycetaceae bacterium]
MTRVCACATAARSTSPDQPAWHAGFLKLLPAIRRHACVCFRHLPAAAREDAIAEVLADAVLAYARLESLGKTDLAYPTVLARYAIGRYREGRRVGSQSNGNDVMSGRCLRRNGVVVQSLHRRDHRTGTWREILVEDRHSTPAQIAATRLDFADWLKTLSQRDRRLAEALALGETTRRVARMFRISAARVSQLRRELCANWRRFVGELTDAGAPSLATA